MKRTSSQKWKLDDLKENPLQQELFRDLSEIELEELSRNMKEEGLRHPIEIRPNGEIIDGHQRARAARKLGWEEIDVVIRHDLEAKGEAAVRRRAIEANLCRRQLSKIGVARLYRALKELERASSKDRAARDGGDLRDRMAAKLGGVSGRTLDRYEGLLDAPPAIQDAVDRGELGIIQALKFLDLTAETQERILTAIQGGQPPKKAFRAHAKPAGRQKQDPTTQCRRAIRRLSEDIGTLEALQTRGPLPEAQAVIAVLERAARLLSGVKRCSTDGGGQSEVEPRPTPEGGRRSKGCTPSISRTNCPSPGGTRRRRRQASQNVEGNGT